MICIEIYRPEELQGFIDDQESIEESVGRKTKKLFSEDRFWGIEEETKTTKPAKLQKVKAKLTNLIHPNKRPNQP